MSQSAMVIACPHCGKQQSQRLNWGQTQSVHCSSQYQGCGKGYRVQVDYNGMVQSVHTSGG